MKVWSTAQSKILQVVTSEVCFWLSQCIHLWTQVKSSAVSKSIRMAAGWIKELWEPDFCLLLHSWFHQYTWRHSLISNSRNVFHSVCVLDSAVLYIYFFYFPRDTAQSVKEKFGKKLYNALLKWVYRLLCSALQSHIFSCFTCGVSVLLVFV